NPQSSTLNPQPSTLNPQPSTLNPQPSTLYPQPSTLNPIPYILHPIPYTLCLTPYTLYPIPYTLFPSPQLPNPNPIPQTLCTWKVWHTTGACPSGRSRGTTRSSRSVASSGSAWWSGVGCLGGHRVEDLNVYCLLFRVYSPPRIDVYFPPGCRVYEVGCRV
ncbi:hypothetical protein T484DRAFT_3636748, partial [Baffinella frigidus]